LSLLYGVFCERRIGRNWAGEVEEIRRWLQQGTRASRSPAA
jgi:hypothetical protein